MKAQEMLENFPEQINPVDTPSLNLRDYAGIVFSGMGGSGIVGDLAKLLLEKSQIDVPVLSVRDYALPSYVKENWAVFCVSYSGNTEETLSIAQEALSRNIKPVCVSSGGKLKELANQRGLMHFALPSGYPPRYALGFMISTVLSLIGMKDGLKACREFLKEKKESIKEQAQGLAQRLEGYIPVVYATPLMDAVALRWKTQINENAKTLCYTATLPELHHNEVVGLDNPITRNLCTFVLLFDPEDHPRNLKRVEITEQILKDLGVVPALIKGEGNEFLNRLFYLIYLGDWASFYLSQLYGYDPIPVQVIDKIKKILSS
ncbi:MAG: bifunctional phosphoglucose/phosphomannose isomerase [Hydrogenobacter thermophilus]|nr:bifunctional phosphoglucose/phosphomannose isomerase [Hydrogenobacter thermophilus]